jgi:hypothetical protein
MLGATHGSVGRAHLLVIEQNVGCEPLAALLFDTAARPDAQALASLAVQSGEFSLVEGGASGAPFGCTELLREGLTFDLGGLAPREIFAPPAYAHTVGLPQDFDPAGLAAVTFAPGPHLAGAQHLMPVVRVAAGLALKLAALAGLRAIIWHPARTIMSPAWFAESIGIWLAGGPFPAMALTALVRRERGFDSEGLAFLVGQEFSLVAKGDAPSREDSRIAVRLTDWLVAHGRVDAACEVVLSGAGAVWLEPTGQNRLNVRVL